MQFSQMVLSPSVSAHIHWPVYQFVCEICTIILLQQISTPILYRLKTLLKHKHRTLQQLKGKHLTLVRNLKTNPLWLLFAEFRKTINFLQRRNFLVKAVVRRRKIIIFEHSLNYMLQPTNNVNCCSVAVVLQNNSRLIIKHEINFYLKSARAGRAHLTVK